MEGIINEGRCVAEREMCLGLWSFYASFSLTQRNASALVPTTVRDYTLYWTRLNRTPPPFLFLWFSFSSSTVQLSESDTLTQAPIRSLKHSNTLLGIEWSFVFVFLFFIYIFFLSFYSSSFSFIKFWDTLLIGGH